MINVENSKTVAPADTGTIELKAAVLKDIGAKWGKFSEADLTGLTGSDDLATKIAAKYGMDKAKAAGEVSAVLNGRHF